MLFKIDVGVGIDRFLKAAGVGIDGHLGDHVAQAVEGFLAPVNGVESKDLGDGDLGLVGRIGAVFLPEFVGVGHGILDPRVRLLANRLLAEQGDEVEQRLAGDDAVFAAFGQLKGLLVVVFGFLAVLVTLEDVALEVEGHVENLDVGEFLLQAVQLLEGGSVFVFRVVAVGAVEEAEGVVDVFRRIGVLLEEGVEQLGGLGPELQAGYVGGLEVERGLLELALGILLDVLVEQRLGLVVLAGVVVAAAEDVEADVVLLRSFRKLRQHLDGDGDAGLVFAFVEERGEHHAADGRDVLGVGIGLEEARAVLLGGHHLADDGAGPDEVVEVVLALLRLGEEEFELLVGSEGTAGVAVLFVDEGGRTELDHLVRVAFAALRLEVVAGCLEVLLHQRAGEFLHPRAAAKAGEAGLQVLDHHVGGRHQLIERDRAGFHVGTDGIAGELQVETGVDFHLEGLDDDLGAVLLDEGE